METLSLELEGSREDILFDEIYVELGAVILIIVSEGSREDILFDEIYIMIDLYNNIMIIEK